ncbi:MAG: transcriptional repressor [Actinomycetaceae bacterium]|nr:transcriptional repressor [Actinomycetaceae bacterium]MDY6083049.1 transcriptional repressor [Actinomycetaceae bacterium]
MTHTAQQHRASERSASTGRKTHQRAVILAWMEKNRDFLSAQDIHTRINEQGEHIGLATVYRTLAALAEDGHVDVLRTQTQTLYRACETSAHHHHVVCRRCGMTLEIEMPELETLARASAHSAGFIEIDHVLEISGICPSCQQELAQHADSSELLGSPEHALA